MRPLLGVILAILVCAFLYNAFASIFNAVVVMPQQTIQTQAAAMSDMSVAIQEQSKSISNLADGLIVMSKEAVDAAKGEADAYKSGMYSIIGIIILAVVVGGVIWSKSGRINQQRGNYQQVYYPPSVPYVVAPPQYTALPAPRRRGYPVVQQPYYYNEFEQEDPEIYQHMGYGR